MPPPSAKFATLLAIALAALLATASASQAGIFARQFTKVAGGVFQPPFSEIAVPSPTQCQWQCLQSTDTGVYCNAFNYVSGKCQLANTRNSKLVQAAGEAFTLADQCISDFPTLRNCSFKYINWDGTLPVGKGQGVMYECFGGMIFTDGAPFHTAICGGGDVWNTTFNVSKSPLPTCDYLCFATFPLPDNSAKQATGNWTGAYPGRLGDTASFSCNTWYIFSNGAGTVHTKYCDFGNTWTDMSGMNSKCVDQFLTSLGPLQLDQVNQNWNQYVTKDTKPWWRYHMGDERTVTGIYVRFNVDFYECHSANNLEVRVGYTDWTPENTNWLQSNALCTTFAGANCLDDCTQYMTLNCKAPLKGRILSIQKVDVAGYIYSTWDTSIPCEWNSGGFPSDLPLMHIWILFG